MNKNHFMISYAGNKRTECENIYNSIKDKLEDIEYIVEPFCGSCAFSVYMSLKHPKKFKYVINDNNKMMIDFIKLTKDNEKFTKFVEDLKKLYDKTNKENYQELVKKSNDDLMAFVYIHKIYALRAGLFPTTKLIKKEIFDKMLNCSFVNFINSENVTITNKEAVEVYEQYKQNDKALLFLDPPYLKACNDFYNDAKLNIYEYLYHNDINNEQSKIILCLEKNWIINLLFMNKRIIEYNKKYQPSKKDTTHLIILNNKF